MAPQTKKTKRKRLGPTPFQKWLKELGACMPARRWVGRKTIAQAWSRCPDTGWMAWLLAYLPREDGACGCYSCRFGISADNMTPEQMRAKARRLRIEIALPGGGR